MTRRFAANGAVAMAVFVALFAVFSGVSAGRGRPGPSVRPETSGVVPSTVARPVPAPTVGTVGTAATTPVRRLAPQQPIRVSRPAPAAVPAVPATMTPPTGTTTTAGCVYFVPGKGCLLR